MCSFLILNLFVAIIMKNFDYLTMDWSLLGPHHLERYLTLWARFDPEATGRIQQTDLIALLKLIEPPLGFGMRCPYREVCKRLVGMNMMMYSDGTVDFHTTLFALIRQSLQLKKPSVSGAPSKEDAALRSVIKLVFPRVKKDLLDKLIPKPDMKERITVGQFYATFLIRDYLQRYQGERNGERPARRSQRLSLARRLSARLSGASLEKWQSDSSFEEL